MVRRQDKGCIAPVKLGRLIDSADGILRKAVEGIGVQHERNIHFQKPRYHIDAACSSRNARATEHAGELFGGLTHRLARSSPECAA